MALTARDSEERALAMAMVIMGANTAGIYGAQIFRGDDSPRYRRGFSINIAVLALAVGLATIRYLDDIFRRRRLSKASDLPIRGGNLEELDAGSSSVGRVAKEGVDAAKTGHTKGA
ncbi:uncharacterized protein IL334_007446 [Kwoniella shivajii]|uniref:Uncharacterized protein n=1 Tax=Kwoniella shivajii TaxID=564305 RepID=A0ABZ1D8P1_9TREE|nr:hypothetical protein IL334_007446 [Kwoniella shivajii]